MHMFLLVVLQHPVATLAPGVAALLYQFALIVLPFASGWIAGEVALFRNWVQQLGGFWGAIVSAVVAGVFAFGGMWVVQHFPGVTVPPDLTGVTPEWVVSFITAILKAWLGVSQHLQRSRRLRGLSI